MNSTIAVAALVRDLKKTFSAVYTNPTLCEQYAWWTLEAILKTTQANLLAEHTITLTDAQKHAIAQWVESMVHKHMPIQYLLGSVPFGQSDIFVEPPILIPRPETEGWVMNLSAQLSAYAHKKLTILDLCCGSGCIAIALAKALPASTVYAVDIAEHALALTRKNIVHNSVHNVVCMHSNLFASIPEDLRFDLIVSNPPYIDRTMWQTLDLSVTTWEDPQALIADDQGLAIIKTIIANAPSFLATPAQNLSSQLPNVWIEIGFDQGHAVATLFKHAGYTSIEIHKDLEGKDRVVSGRIEHVATTKNS